MDIPRSINVPIWIIPNSTFGIRVFEEEKKYNIICNHGTLMSITFHASLYIVLNKITQIQESNKLNQSDKNDIDILFKDLLTFGNALLMLNVSGSYPLPDFRQVFDNNDFRCLNYLLFFSELFLFRHENAHISLNHFTDIPFVSYFYDNQSLLVPEENDNYKRMEFEADIYALRDIPDNLRRYLLIGAQLVLEIVISYERFVEKLSDTHPLSINRLNNLFSQNEYIIKGDIKRSHEILQNSRKIIEEGLRFSGIPPEEKRMLLLRKYPPKYVSDYVEWGAGYVVKIAEQYGIALKPIF